MTELMPFVVAMMAAGYLTRRLGLVRAEAARDLNQLVFNVTLPPLIFEALRRADLAWSLLALPAVAWALSLAGSATVLLLARSLKLPRATQGALALAAVFGNTTFFGYPVVQGFYGHSGLTLAIFYDLLGATLATNTVGVLLASTYGTADGVQVRAIAGRLLRFPPIWALVLGLAFHGVAVPAPLEALLGKVGALTSPLIMFAIGLQLRFSAWREGLGLVALASGLRLLVLPALVLLALVALGLDPALRRVAVLQAAMPTMFYSLTLAQVFGLPAQLSVNCIMVSTLLSFATLPLWRLVLG